MQVSELILYLLLHWSARKMCIPNASMHNGFLTSSYSVLLFCFFFSLGKKDKFRRNNGCVKSCYTYQEPLPTWSEEDNNIQFTLQVCVLWQFQSPVKFIYLFVMIHKGFSHCECICVVFHSGESCSHCSSWQIYLWSSFTQRRIHHLRCLIPMLKCNGMPQTCILCPLPQPSFVLFLPTTSSIAYAQTIFLSVTIACFAFVSFVYFLNIYTLIQVTSSQETISSYYHASK